jgi:hypothetical protein
MDWAGETPTPQELIEYFFIWKSLKSSQEDSTKILVHLSGLELLAQNLSSGRDMGEAQYFDCYTKNLGHDKPY